MNLYIKYDQLFEQWGLDVIALLNPNLSKWNLFILTTIDHGTRWTNFTLVRTIDGMGDGR